MADYFGACTGSASKYYDLWLNVTQNSQSIEHNTTNVTIKLNVRRNDGYSSSAYNLDEWKNSASITVNGETKIYRNLEIDTRNSATVILAEWTGDIYNNADGSLLLDIVGQFSMGNANLSGGTVSGSFTCSIIPRTSSLSLSVTEICPGWNIDCAVSSASAEFSHSVEFSIGEAWDSIWLQEGVNWGSFTVPLDWAYQMSWTTGAYISIILSTYRYGQYIGSNTYSVKLNIPDTNDFKPTFNLSVEKIDNGVPADWGVYIKGISGVKVDVNNLDLKYGAVVVNCETKVGNQSQNTVPAWFYLLDSGNVEISVSIRDSRGLTYTQSVTVFVNDYYPPSVIIYGLRRCNINGDLNENGNYIMLDYGVNYCDVSGKNSLVVSSKFRQSSSDIWSDEIVLNGSPVILGNGMISQTNSYVFQFTVYDRIHWAGIVSERVVPSADIPFNIKKGGKGAAFGCYAENENELTVGWNLNLKGKLQGVFNEVSFTDNFSEIAPTSGIRSYPCLNMNFLFIGVIPAVDIPAHTDFVIGYTSIKPADHTPITVRTGGYGYCESFINGETGEIIIRTHTVIPKGAVVRLNGFYINY